MEITSTKQLMGLLFTDRPYTAEENAAITAWLDAQAAFKDALREAVAAEQPAYRLNEVTVNDSTTMYKPVTRWQVVPEGGGGYIGWVETYNDSRRPWQHVAGTPAPRQDVWYGWRHDGHAYRATARYTRDEAVIDAFTDYLIVNTHKIRVLASDNSSTPNSDKEG